MEEFRLMRRKRQQISEEETKRILMCATSGVLAVCGDNDYPYAVPISFVYADNKIYFHSAVTGHKIDAIRNNPKVSFCVIDKDEVKPQKFTTYFRSVIAFGKAEIIEDVNEKMYALRLLSARYCDHEVTPEMTDKEINGGFNHLLMIRINIEHITGKQAIELINK